MLAPTLRPTLRPTLCAVCRGWDRCQPCAACVSAARSEGARCRRCAIRLPGDADVRTVALCGACIVDPPPQDCTVAAVDYAHPWDVLIARFKFEGALDLAGPLGGRLADAVQRAGAAAPDLIVPAPLAPARFRDRGYNQAWEIARRIAHRIGRRADARLVLRIGGGMPQAGLPREQRIAAVRGAYTIEPRRRAELAGTHVAVVDDVLTTGATAAEIARTLLAAGAARVSVWVIARTPVPGSA